MPPGDSSAVREAIRRLVANRAFARTLAQNAKVAAAAYTPDRFIQRILEIVEECAGRRGAASSGLKARSLAFPGDGTSWGR